MTIVPRRLQCSARDACVVCSNRIARRCRVGGATCDALRCLIVVRARAHAWRSSARSMFRGVDATAKCARDTRATQYLVYTRKK